MDAKAISGAKIAVIVEHKFIPEEVAAYRDIFGFVGADNAFPTGTFPGLDPVGTDRPLFTIAGVWTSFRSDFGFGGHEP